MCRELIQGPNFNKPRAPQGLVSQLKSVKERPELEGKRKVIVGSDVVEEESPEPPLATKNLDQPLSKSENHLTRLKQLVKIFLRLSHHKFNNQCAGRKLAQIERRSKLREDEFKLRGEVEAAKQEVEEQARDLAAAKA